MRRTNMPANFCDALPLRDHLSEELKRLDTHQLSAIPASMARNGVLFAVKVAAARGAAAIGHLEIRGSIPIPRER